MGDDHPCVFFLVMITLCILNGDFHPHALDGVMSFMHEILIINFMDNKAMIIHLKKMIIH